MMFKSKTIILSRIFYRCKRILFVINDINLWYIEVIANSFYSCIAYFIDFSLVISYCAEYKDDR